MPVESPVRRLKAKLTSERNTIYGGNYLVPKSAHLFHLGQLKHAGLLSARRHSRSIAYAADYSTMNVLLKFLTENCCGGKAEICAPVPPCNS
jgi:hypothetical protein